MAVLHSQRDQPDTQREYETIYIVEPNSADRLGQINERIRKVVEGDGGTLLRVENWGKRKLAYEIKRATRGIYLYWRYLGPPHLVAELERNLRMLDPVIRYLTVKVDENVDPNARPSDIDDERFAAAAATIPDEEDIAMGRIPGQGAADAAEQPDASETAVAAGDSSSAGSDSAVGKPEAASADSAAQPDAAAQPNTPVQSDAAVQPDTAGDTSKDDRGHGN